MAQELETRWGTSGLLPHQLVGCSPIGAQLEEYLLSEQSGLSERSSPALSEGPGMLHDQLECCGDELELLGRQLDLEEAWYDPEEPAEASYEAPAPGLSPTPAGLAAAEDDDDFELLKRLVARQREAEAALEAEQQQQQQQQQEQQQQQQQEVGPAPAAGSSGGAAGSAAGAEPCTPQRRSAGGSSWNESALPGGHDCGEVQSPAPASLLGPPSAPPAPCPAASRSVPLSLAIHNAQRVRLGREPLLGAWRGCGASAWCALAPRHAGTCAPCALVPGLMAYPAHELFESGVNVEELCRVPEGAPQAPDTESEGCEGGAALAARTAGDCQSSGKRRAADEGAGHSRSQSGCGDAGACGGTASSGGGLEGEQQGSVGSRPGKRARADACSAASLEAGLAGELVGTSRADTPPLPSRMVPVAMLLPAPPAATPAKLAPPVPPLGSAAARNRGRPAGAPRLKPLPPPPPPAPAAPVAHPPSKPVTRQKSQPHQHHVSFAGASERRAAPRSSGRRAILQWHSEAVVDPRTGATVTEVAPGTFCTQASPRRRRGGSGRCYALSTPVWRAGPFGHKTLCNACGVRWMKASKGSKK